MNSTQTKSRTQSENGIPKQRFPFLDLQAEFATVQEEVLAAVKSVLESQRFIMGPEVGKLEAAIAKHVGCSFAIGCASGSDALLLALMALGVDSGDEVITVPFTFVATAGSIARLKAKPVFVDIDPATYNLDWKQLEAAITPRTKAIIPVHLFGLPAEMGMITGDSTFAPNTRHRRCRTSHRIALPGSVRWQSGCLWVLQLFPFEKPGGGR